MKIIISHEEIIELVQDYVLDRTDIVTDKFEITMNFDDAYGTVEAHVAIKKS